MEKINLKFKTKAFINMFTHIFLKFNILFQELKAKKRTIEVFTKEDNEKFTNFDWTYQKIIENYLAKYFNEVNFIGEENTKEVMVNNDFTDFLTTVDDITFNPLDNLEYDDVLGEIDQKELFIYCDPIDSTNSFIKGKYCNATVLIGVTYKKKPVLGIIHFFSYEEKEPRTYFNVPGSGVFSLNVDDSKLSSNSNCSEYKSLEYKLEKLPMRKVDKINFVITSSRENSTMKQSK